MPNPWKEPKALGKLLDIEPGAARQLIRKHPEALKQARSAKRQGVDPHTIFETKNDQVADDGRKPPTGGAVSPVDKLQAVKSLCVCNPSASSPTPANRSTNTAPSVSSPTRKISKSTSTTH